MVNISTLASAVAHRLGSDAVVLSVTRLGDILHLCAIFDGLFITLGTD